MSLFEFALPVLFYSSVAAAAAVLFFGMNILWLGRKSPYFRLKQKQLTTGWKWIGLGLVIALASFFIWQRTPVGLPLMVGKSPPTSTASVDPTSTATPTKFRSLQSPTKKVVVTADTLTAEVPPTVGNTKVPTFTPTITFTPTVTNTKAPTFTPSLTNTRAPTRTPTLKPTFAPTWTQKVATPTIVKTLAPTATAVPGQ